MQKLLLSILLLIFSCDEVLESEDCTGVIGGGAIIDDCEQCTGGTTGKLFNYLQDCEGVCGGNSVQDECGVCNGDGIPISFCDCEGNKYDCEGICGGDILNCEECENGFYDCFGICDGTAIIDCAGVCGGSSTEDCAGVCGGDAVEDCAGECDGSAVLSGCDSVCNSTAVEDCAGVCGGDAVEDCAGECDGSAVLSGCDSVCNSTAVEDCAGVCGGDAVEDCAGVCGGDSDPEEPEFNSIYSSHGKTCDCIGNIWDCVGVCGGDNVDGIAIDCDGDCISESTYGNWNDILGDAWCHDNIYACAEHNCDQGDCGNWNGSQCVGGAAIKYDVSQCTHTPKIDLILDIYSTDQSIPNTFIIDYYYEAITGTYNFSYTHTNHGGTNQFVSGYYTTYNQINDDNKCFHLWLSILGANFYEWHPMFNQDCGTFFGYNILSRVLSHDQIDDQLEKYNEQLQKFNQYIELKEKENEILNRNGTTNTGIINSSIVKINNPQYNLTIMEIDNDPNVIIQQGENYIMKYVKKINE